MKLILKILIINISLFIFVIAHDDPTTDPPIPHVKTLTTIKSANASISPEIINELKDFENLIPTTTIDAIVAKHYLIDGNFRTALNYLRSNEFTQLQRQLLTIPEIIDVLEFLHLTTTTATATVNATKTMHMGATNSKTEQQLSLDDYNDNRIDKMTTNAATNDAVTTSNTRTIITTSPNGETMTKKPYRRPPFARTDTNDDYPAVDGSNIVPGTYIAKEPLVRILLLENSEVKTQAYDVVIVNAHNDKLNPSPPNDHHHQQQHHHQQNCHHHHHHRHQQQRQRSLGTFTTFVQEILEHLPNTAYQNMIKDKCRKNVKFADFYKALRSPEFKPIVDEAMKTPNIMKIIQMLNSNDIDVKSLEPIGFQVISWGPNV